MASERYTTEQVIDALVRAKGIQTQAAQLLGCERRTVARYIDKYATVKYVYEDLREALIDKAEHETIKLLHAGYWPAIRFVLSTLGCKRGYVQQTDITSGGRRLGACEFIEITHSDANDEPAEE